VQYVFSWASGAPNSRAAPGSAHSSYVTVHDPVWVATPTLKITALNQQYSTIESGWWYCAISLLKLCQNVVTQKSKQKFSPGRFSLSRFGLETFWSDYEILHANFLLQTYLNQRKVLFSKNTNML